MGLATIINMICFVCVPAWGQWAATLAWALWWIDAVISLANNMYLPFVMYELLINAPMKKSTNLKSQYVSALQSTLRDDRRLATSYSFYHCRCRFGWDRGFGVGESTACALDHHHQLHTLGNRGTPCNDGAGNVLPSPDDPQNTAQGSHRVCLPSFRPIGPRRLRHHATRKRGHEGLS